VPLIETPNFAGEGGGASSFVATSCAGLESAVEERTATNITAITELRRIDHDKSVLW
jgi:hypothetical protein